MLGRSILLNQTNVFLPSTKKRKVVLENEAPGGVAGHKSPGMAGVINRGSGERRQAPFLAARSSLHSLNGFQAGKN
jgi:hypothetical protein